jgi:hypothetical protein
MDETERGADVKGGGTTPIAATRVATGPLGWSAARRMSWATAFCVMLWLAVLWAVS